MSRTSGVPPHTVSLNTPAINGLVVDINGVALPGPHVSYIQWDWGDFTPVEQHFFPHSHPYGTGGTYTITVTAYYDDATTAFAQVVVTVGSGIQSGGFNLEINNLGAGGSVSYDSSVGPGTVPSGTSKTLYLAYGDPVWSITAAPDSGYSFDKWTVTGTDVEFNSGYDQHSNPVSILVYTDGAITVNFGPALAVPEYLYGALLAMLACFAAFVIIKKPHLNLRIR